MPDRAGVGITFLNKLRFIRLALPRIGALYGVRAAVVDPRTLSVRKTLRLSRD